MSCPIKKQLSSYGLKGAFIVTGIGTLAYLAARFLEKRQVSGELVLENVKRFFIKTIGTIEGSWIELEAVWNAEWSCFVYYGGMTHKDGETVVQYEFVADAKTGALLDLYVI